MANEKDYEWAEASNLSKVKIGGTTYNLKDAEARQVIDSEASKLAAEVSRAKAAEEALAAEISDETSRAEAAEASIAADLATEVSTRASEDAKLDKRIAALEARGRYLSTWDASTGLPGDYPQIPEGATSPYTYTYKAGDYYIINNVPATGTKYMPDGASITATKSGETWTWEIGKKEYTGEAHLVIGGQFLYSTSSWTYIATAKDVAWGNITGNLSDQTDLYNALGGKVDKVTGKSLVLDTEISKLATVEENAEKNIIEIVKVDGTALEVASSDRSVNVIGIASLRADLNAEISARASADENIMVEVNKKAAVSIAASGTSEVNAKYITVNGSEYKLGDVDKAYVDEELAKKQNVINADNKLDADYLKDGTTNKVYTATEKTKLGGIEASAQVNVIETIKLNGSEVEVTGKTVDLGNIAVAANTVNEVSYDASAHKLQRTKNGTVGDVHQFGALAEKSSASGTVEGQTISGVKGTVTSAGSISVTLGADTTAIESTGSIVAKGSIAVSLSDNAASKLATAGSIATFTEGAFTPAEIKSGFYTEGSAATWTGASYTAPSLGDATKATFASEGIKAHVGDSTKSEDIECLYFEAAGTAQAVTDRGTWNAGSHSFGTFNGGTPTVIDTTKFSGGSKASDTFNGGAMPTFDAVTVTVASATFTGQATDISVSGNYEKAKINEAKFIGASATVSVNDITVESKNVTVQ